MKLILHLPQTIGDDVQEPELDGVQFVVLAGEVLAQDVDAGLDADLADVRQLELVEFREREGYEVDAVLEGVV